MSQVVYVLENQDTKRIKIGVSGNLRNRVSALQAASGCKIDVLYNSPPLNNAKKVESAAHDKFDDYRYLGEWFVINPIEAIKYISSIIKPSMYSEWYISLSGKSITEIAKDKNVSRQYIHRMINDFGIDRHMLLPGTNKNIVNKKEVDTNIVDNLNDYIKNSDGTYKNKKDGAIYNIKYSNGSFTRAPI